MLLLVVKAELDNGRGRSCRLPGSSREERLHGLVDRPPVRVHLGHRGPREVTALGARVLGPDRLVVRVEQHPVVRVSGLVPGQVGCQDKRLEEPGHVRQMPLRRTDVGHRLDNVVVDLERRAQPLRRRADVLILSPQAVEHWPFDLPPPVCRTGTLVRRVPEIEASHVPISLTMAPPPRISTWASEPPVPLAFTPQACSEIRWPA
jgi:hypothetical protein